jgi:ATP-dependent exoDNAse (exonuclease V) beta subunit
LKPSACEDACVNVQGELKRINRLVEFDDVWWMLDYKLGDREDARRYRSQMQEYRTAMQAVYAGKTCAVRWCLRMAC